MWSSSWQTELRKPRKEAIMAKTSGNVRGANINHEAIDKARSILKHFDFHWQMVE